LTALLAFAPGVFLAGIGFTFSTSEDSGSITVSVELSGYDFSADFSNDVNVYVAIASGTANAEVILLFLKAH